ncbi:MAG: CRISPR-associated endonuclease Cas6 [Haliscomenobacter sp.]|uniref:CRISPR-associated endonuclease Cas6 n=1 Tax=Haliscomenobacter sp. TaxID=2717303 RepID=UPI0029BDF6FA|nr:CRISPR-associated endonuclease Cas6 [Haliscomenobacter sp.]MDX2070754.1 CRISPR-associated endonuclease Cas6 [Haliscomenobacter sp.]
MIRAQKHSDSSDATVQCLSVTFDLALDHRQIAQWRGAFVEMAGREFPLLHNHQENGAAIYQYPLVQYRTHKGKASLFAIGEGMSCLREVLSKRNWELNWQGEKRQLYIAEMKTHETRLKLQDSPQTYRLRQYLGLNQDTYALWQNADGLIERVQLLEKSVRNHLLSCLWGLGWDSKEQVEIKIQELYQAKIINYHAQALMAFDLSFSTRVNIPVGVGIGKAVSHGFGVVLPKAKESL